MKKSRFKEIVKEVLIEDNEYQVFFQKALEKAGKSIPEMGEQEKRDFFNKIDAAWKGRGEKKLVGNQSKLDVDNDGEIEASDLEKLRDTRLGEWYKEKNPNIPSLLSTTKVDAKTIANKMRKSSTMKSWADRVEKMGKVSHRDLEKTLPDYIAGKDIAGLFESVGSTKVEEGIGTIILSVAAGALFIKLLYKAVKSLLSHIGSNATLSKDELLKVVDRVEQGVMRTNIDDDAEDDIKSYCDIIRNKINKGQITKIKHILELVKANMGENKIYESDSALDTYIWKPGKYAVGTESYDDKDVYILNRDDAKILNILYGNIDTKEKAKIWKLFWGSDCGLCGPKMAIKYAKQHIRKNKVGSPINESLNEDSKKVWKYKGVLLVDSDFVNDCKGQLPNSELKHAGMGDFFLQTPDGMISFDRTNGKLNGMSGRAHQMSDNQGGKLMAQLIKKMGAKFVTESIKEDSNIQAGKLLRKIRQDWGSDSDLYYAVQDVLIGGNNVKRLTSVLQNYDVYSDYKRYLKGFGESKLNESEFGKYPEGITLEKTKEIGVMVAKAIAKLPDVKKASLNLKTLEPGGFDIDMDGEEYDGGSYNLYDNGNIVNHAVTNPKTRKSPIVGNWKTDNVNKIYQNFIRLEKDNK